MGKLFNIPDTSGVVMTNSHYYAYLKESKPTDIHAIKTKTAYLESLGFVVGEDKLKEGDLDILKAIEQTYFQIEIKPTLN